jgi:hypothetical protein
MMVFVLTDGLCCSSTPEFTGRLMSCWMMRWCRIRLQRLQRKVESNVEGTDSEVERQSRSLQV